MKRLSALLLCSGVAALAGCAAGTSQAPVPITYPRTDQQKMQAAHHWEVLAEYEANQILSSVKDKSKPIYVERFSTGDSKFKAVYYELLREHLTKQGGVVIEKPMFGSVKVDCMVHVLTHTDRGYVAPAPGTYTAFGAGVVGVSAAAAEWQPAALAALPVLLAADVLSGGHASVEPAEVIITTRVFEGNLVLMSDTDIFYYNPGDTNHYLDHLPVRPGQSFQVVDR